MAGSIKKFIELVKFEHTVFALPFAYMGMVLAEKAWPGWDVFLWVTLAMAGARTVAMALNRIIDRGIDGKNPRTRHRALVTGEIKVVSAWTLAVASAGVFFFSAHQLNSLCFKLSPVALLFLVGYHYVKRFSYLCHWTLGMVLGIAPLGGWMAVTGTFSWKPLVLSLAVMLWVAGFDILYSLQAADFDRDHKLHSAPVRWGIWRALKLSEYCHWATAIFLTIFGVIMPMGVLYWVGLALVLALLKFEHIIVGDGDLSRVNTVFFTINGWIGVLLLIFTLLDLV